MAVSKARISELPKDAVIISEEEALFLQMKIISKWDKWREVWALRYAPVMISAMSIGTSAYVNNYFRKRMCLGKYGRFSTYLPIVVIPTLISYGSQKAYIQRVIILKFMDICPVCIQMRAAGLQALFGVLYPSLLAPMAACMFATRHYTYRLPIITQKPLEVLKLFGRFMKPIYTPLSVIAICQALFTIYLTYKQQQQYFDMRLQFQKFEHSVEKNLIPQSLDI